MSVQQIQDNVRVHHSHEHSAEIKISDLPSDVKEGKAPRRGKAASRSGKGRKTPQVATTPSVASTPSVAPVRLTNAPRTSVDGLDAKYMALAEKMKDVVTMSLAIQKARKARRDAVSSSSSSTTLGAASD